MLRVRIVLGRGACARMRLERHVTVALVGGPSALFLSGSLPSLTGTPSNIYMCSSWDGLAT